MMCLLDNLFHVMTQSITGANRLHSLDALRGVAALAVVFWHWQHFALIGPVTETFDRKQQPLYDLFRMFYDHGWLAVDLFFSLSGFIFFWLYSESISARTITSSRFFILRFSRLYPLHITTLFFVTISQLVYVAKNGQGYVYSNTDLWHFALNVFLLSSVGLENGYSYNGPIWSVSVESLLYLIFFAFCRLKLNKPAVMILVSFIGFTMLYRFYAPVGKGVGSFFLGGLTCIVFSRINKQPTPKSATVIIIATAILLWIATIAHVYLDITLKSLPVLWRLSDILPLERFAEILLFPMSILSLALFESQFSLIIPGLELLGNISYSSYLLHFPLQITFALLLPAIGVANTFFQTGISLLLFFFLLILISTASYKYLEMPAQRHIRDRWPIGKPF